MNNERQSLQLPYSLVDAAFGDRRRLIHPCQMSKQISLPLGSFFPMGTSKVYHFSLSPNIVMEGIPPPSNRLIWFDIACHQRRCKRSGHP